MIERYSREEMKSIWSIENKYTAWLQVEKSVVHAWYVLGRIPEEDYNIIEAFSTIDVDAIADIEAKTRHDVIAFITYMEEQLGSSGRFVHFGCTSSDIVDTANALLLREAGTLLLKDIEYLLDVLASKIEATRGIITIGRTHGIHAEPTTYALKFASFYAEFKRNYIRMERAVEGISVGKISGAVGTYAFLSPKVEELACSYLGLACDTVSTQIIQRDRYAEFFTTIAIIAGTIERLCVELRHLQRTEVAEVEEGFAKGQKGSSAMPHKKNPISAENLTGISRVLRSNAFTSLENMVLWHERDISHSSAERIIMPDSTIALDYSLNRLAGVIENLVIKKDAIERTLNSSFGLFFSQRILSALIEHGIGRQKAYELVQKYALQAFDERIYFPKLVQEAEEICAVLSKKELEEIFDIEYYTKYEAKILERVLAYGIDKEHQRGGSGTVRCC